MSSMFVITYLALWGIVLLQSLAILLLLRQVGKLHLRIAPAGARVMAGGPEIGEPAPRVSLKNFNEPQQEVDVSDSMPKDLYLLFVSPGCAICASIMPAFKSLARQWKHELDWAVVAYGHHQGWQEFVRKSRLEKTGSVHAPEVAKLYKIGATPYAVLIRKDRTVLAKGLVNQIEHLESILEARNALYERQDNSNEGKTNFSSGEDDFVALRENSKELEA